MLNYRNLSISDKLLSSKIDKKILEFINKRKMALVPGILLRTRGCYAI